MNEFQNILKKAALSSDPPMMTNDPVVNHAVDCHMEDSVVPYDKQLYTEEISAWKNSGGLLLSL